MKSEYKKQLFKDLFKKHSSLKCSKIMKISRGMLYHYKNDRVRSVPLTIINDIKELLDVEQYELDKNTIKILSSECVKNFGLDLGREVRRKQLKKFRMKIPKIQEIIENNALNLEKWFFHYKKLIDFGCREIKSISRKENYLEIIYTNYANGKKKSFKTLLPRKIVLNEDFLYFFGLWVGDKAGGGRIGVVNKDKLLNFVTLRYLKKLYQKPVFDLYIHKNTKMPNLDYKIDKVIVVDSSHNGYAIAVYATNGILKSFFDYLDNNLDALLSMISHKNVFFAGLFDAEGNVLIEASSFRWSCKNQEKRKIFVKHLKTLNLFHRFDDSNIVSYNKEIFSKQILPFIKHPKKINNTNIVCFGHGVLPKKFKEVLLFIKENAGQTHKEIAKALKRVYVSSHINVLRRLSYIRKEGYPHKMYINQKGVAALSHGGKDA
ncbi:MAG: hypothetical protein KKE98_05895 [Nanoarchaeota archaeon]|nr:hypothetical protein [Nanoarchaeota archaeon]